MSLDWRGNEVFFKVGKSATVGVNRTMGDAVKHAKANHPFQNQTGTAERSIRVAVPAKRKGRFVVGLWGSIQVNYFKWLEFGTPGGRKAYPTLRPAAAITYPNLVRHMTQEWIKISGKGGRRK